MQVRTTTVVLTNKTPPPSHLTHRWAGIKLQVKTRVWTHDTHGFDASKQSSDRNVLVNDLLGIGLNAVATTITYNHTRKDLSI